MTCLIGGCDEQATHICRGHWFKLPLTLRRRYWKETDFGKKKPDENLVRAIRESTDV